MNPQLWWQVARAGGLVAYGLLAASTIWGLAVSTRLLGRWPAPGWTLDLHRYLGGLALTFTGIHLAALLLDSYIQFDVLDLLVPFAAAWRPGAVAWGVVAVYLLLQSKPDVAIGLSVVLVAVCVAVLALLRDRWLGGPVPVR